MHVRSIFHFLREQQKDIWVDLPAADAIELTGAVWDRFSSREALVAIPARNAITLQHVQVQLHVCTGRNDMGWNYDWARSV